MSHSLIVTQEADRLLEGCIRYLVYRLKNEQAATHLFDEIEKIYTRLEDNPYQFPESPDRYLQKLGYHEAICSEMKYVVIFRIEDDVVYVLGIYHQLENYCRKIVSEKRD